MGTLYKVTCSNCSHVGELSWGDGIFHLQFQCNECLKLFNIPRKAPRANRNGRDVPKFLEKHDFKSLPPTTSNEIIRFSDENLKAYLETRSQWQHGDDEWDNYEIEQLISLVSCDCDSDLTHVSQKNKPQIKCNSCKSSSIHVSIIGTSD
jgi:hypothetical protein